MPRPSAPPGRTGRPPVTSRAQILAVARRLIDQDGWAKLSIRRLAAEIGIGPTTLYHHVRDKEDLLILLLREYADQLPRPVLPAGPRDRIVVAAATIHEALAAWPWAAEVLTTDGFLGRLGDSARWLVEAIVAAAVDHGCTPAEGVYVFRSIWYYTVGEILVRAHSAGQPADRDAFTAAALDDSELPREWPELVAQNTFRRGLEAFVDGLLAQPV
ncbi:MAG: TetR/AcrR family transcriptional regulator [Actinoplanes sp.]